jgi:hypothetical protein
MLYVTAEEHSEEGKYIKNILFPKYILGQLTNCPTI